MTSKYNKTTHSFEEQPWMSKPDRSNEEYSVHAGYDGSVNYLRDKLTYDKHIDSLRIIPCRPGDQWEEGKIYTEGVDYKVKGADEWKWTKQLNGNIFVAAIVPPPQPSEAELWKEVAHIKDFYQNKISNAIGMGAMGLAENLREQMENAIQEKYVITRKDEVPEAVEFAEWAKRNDWLFDPEIGNWFHADDKEMSGVDLYKEFQLFKKQKP